MLFSVTRLTTPILAAAFALMVSSLAPVASDAQGCAATAATLNTQFTTVQALQPDGNLPEASGVLAHTIHGPGLPPVPPGAPGYLDFAKLEALTPDLTKTCGDYLNEGTFLPWCGSNLKPLASPPTFSDASSWTFVRTDTVIHGAQPGTDEEVVCDAGYDKRYGLIFANAYMNQNDNLGCMYPLDGDTGNRDGKGCGASTHDWPNDPAGQASCPVSDSPADYEADFANLITASGSRAGSLICSLGKSQFNTWVDVRKRVDLSDTIWPVNEFVLWNWDTYSTKDIADNGYLVGIYYLSGCERTSVDGDPAVAARIAKLFKDWTGVDVPVVNLSNAAIRNRTDTPFSCP